MDKEINYKKLWFEVCEEKKQLELENHTLKVNGNYYLRQFEKFEKLYGELIQSDWNKDKNRVASLEKEDK